MQPDDSGIEAAAALAGVLTPTFLRKLDRVRLTVRRSLSTRPGNTPMPRGAQGSGIELESHKPYGEGDDLRHLDWNAYGRLDALLIKTFRAEREVPLHVFVDTSASMAVPSSDNKLGFALGLAASLAYISLRNHDPVRIVSLNHAVAGAHLSSPLFRHRAALPRVRDFLLQLRCGGTTTLAAGLAAALRTQRTPGLAILLSDFLTPPEVYEQALGNLVARRYTVAAIRVMGPGEHDPARLFRRARVIDAETGAQRLMTLSAENTARYARALEDHHQRLRAFCTRCGVLFSLADTAAGLEQSLFHDLPALGLLH